MNQSALDDETLTGRSRSKCNKNSFISCTTNSYLKTMLRFGESCFIVSSKLFFGDAAGK